MRSHVAKLDWNETDDLAVDTVRVLAMDAVQKVGNGHPGTAMSLAPAAYLLFQKVMRHNPADPHWPGRDRFVLSCGHSSLTLYIQLYLGGWGLELEDLKSLRTWGSKTPGPPGVRPHRRRRDHHRPARPGRRQRGRHGDGRPPRARPARPQRRRSATRRSTTSSTRCASDGDLEEGVSGEASSIAGTQQLGNLILIYDDNKISIEDNTDIAFNEDVAKRYEAYGWHVQHVDWTHGGHGTAGLPRGRARAVRRDPQGRAGHRQAELHRLAHDHRLAGPQRSRTPARPTATPSATTRSPPPRRSSASTPTRPSRCRRPSSSTPARPSSAARPRGPSGRRRTTRGRASRPPTSTSTSGCRPAPCPTGWADALPTLPGRREGDGHPQGQRRA